MITYHQINLTQYSDGWTCSAWETSYQAYIYARKHFRHFHADTGSRRIVLISTCEIEKYQADNIINKFVRGEFHKQEFED
jgi:predicted lactoylglutathione lyase